jgi:photosystem II stability/assembly factor-like uncharacterized protein
VKKIVVVFAVIIVMTAGLVSPALAKKKTEETEDVWSAGTFAGLKFRLLGPALTSGRVSDIAVHPDNRAHYFVSVASGGVWKTTNDGTTWTPVFDDQGSYSLGCVTIDPNDPLTVWVGTGENNSQRSVSYGDGVYKSVDGGTTWSNVGLESSEHIGKIVVDPRDSNVVYVAAQGPLWAPGGDRGLYKTEDGGKTWNAVLEISENTGVSDVVMDPRNPDVLYAAAYQRRRRVWTLIDGGPESAIHKSTDAGTSWTKLETGLPTVDIGRIGLAIAPTRPDTVYAIIEAEGEEGGFFRSTDAGANWEKRSDYVSGSPQYYQEIIPDPVDPDRVYSNDTWMHVTEDGGKTFVKVGEKTKHVDNHALWIDPENTDYLLAGCDGGVYETFDRGATWRFKANLPITQFYKIGIDNDLPFYNVYGGTQDNFTLGGPSRSTSANGIVNSDWFVTLGGDGFDPVVDPEDPNIVYSQYQYGGLSRFDRRSGEGIDIQPQPAPGDDALRWNWDSALILSPHSPTRLYFAAQRIFRSDDRGDTWTPISGDLTRALDRNKLETMGKIQRADAVAKHRSTSPYGNIVSLSESPLLEGLIYAGTDDGLIQVTEDGGKSWRKIDRFAGVPEMSYVSDIETSRHDTDTVYAAFDNHKVGDFKPYVLKSTDRGRSWTGLTGDLPERGTVYSIAEDHVRNDLLFAGTEFGVFFTPDAGKRWVQLTGGLPVIAVRDLEIQRRENDLVVGTFGRGIYVLDDYAPLRDVTLEVLEGEGALFSIKDAWRFIPSVPLGVRGQSFQGDSYYTAPNPPAGAWITYYLGKALEPMAKSRRSEEKGETPPYPTMDRLRAETREDDPVIFFEIRDSRGEVVRRLSGETGAGFHRVTWDLRYPPSDPTSLEPPSDNPFADPPAGPLALPGVYTVSMFARVDGELSPMGEPREVSVVPLEIATLAAEDREALLDFQRKTARLHRAVLGAVRTASETRTRLDHLKTAVIDTPDADVSLREEVLALTRRLLDLQDALTGDPVLSKYSEPQPPSIAARVDRIVSSQWTSTSPPTQTNRDAYAYAGEAFEKVLADLRQLIETDLASLETRLESAGAPWTPGRVPVWEPE